MASYERVTGAGNVDGRNVYKIRFDTNPCSDQPQLQAWDDQGMTTTAIESLSGTTNNGGESLVAAAHVTNTNTGGAWDPVAGSAGGGAMQDPNSVGTPHRANRLRGAESYLDLGDPADSPPAAGDERFFQLAFGVHDDSGVGTAGHQPVIAVKTFYAGAEPVVSFHYNSGADDLGPGQVGAVWGQLTTEVKGTAMAIGVGNAINVSDDAVAGPLTALSPVVKPGTGEKWAAGQWIQTAL